LERCGRRHPNNMEDGEKQQVSNLIMMYTGKLSTLVPTLKMGPNFLIGKKMCPL
jgi:hypothetical protein